MPFDLVSTKAPGLRFRIVKLDKATMRATLIGDTGVEFERTLSEAELEKFGFSIEKVPKSETVE